MAELTLAIIPLVISAAEHYSDVSRVISRYRRFSERIDDFFSELDVHCGIFQTTVQLLLTSVVGGEQAVRMVQDAEDDAWKDTDLDLCVAERFSGMESAAKNCLRLVQRESEKLLKVCQSYQFIAEEVEQDESRSLRKKARQIGKKINLTCSSTSTDELMRRFSDRIENFRVLVQQTECLTARRVPDEPQAHAKLKIQEFVAVKSAATNLYTAFGKACTKHTEHQGYIGLQPTHGGSDRVNFVLAFKSLTIRSSPNSLSPVEQDVFWLTIESKAEEIRARDPSVRPSGLLGPLQKSAKRAREANSAFATHSSDQKRSVNSEKDRKHARSVSFQADPAVDCSLVQAASTPPILTSSDSMVNFCCQSNFCNKMKMLFNQSTQPAGRCIGYLKTNGSSKHLIYIHSRMSKVATTKDRETMTALSKLLKASSQSGLPGASLPLRTRFHVGKQLALALLQFHQTYWLGESWSSDDIMLSHAKTTGTGRSISTPPYDCTQEPYANVSIRGEDLCSEQSASRRVPQIKNRPLFNFGKILLELAFQKPFQHLRLPEDAQHDPIADSVDFAAAERMLCSVSEEMGERYAEVVRKCIHCDFAQGHDLSSLKLQAAFYQYIICELDTCKKLT